MSPALHDALATLALVVVGLASLLLPKYLEARVAQAARGAVDERVGKVLADHAHELDKQLEEFRKALALQQERYSRDYGLFAARRNEVYAETYSLLEKARGLFDPHLSPLSIGPDFSKALGADLMKFAHTDSEVGPAEREELLACLAGEGDLERARGLASELAEKTSLRRAHAAFRDFKNAFVLNGLYYSQQVTEQLALATGVLSTVATWAREVKVLESVDLGTKAAKAAELDDIAADLRHTMRAEMQAGFSQKAST